MVPIGVREGTQPISVPPIDQVTVPSSSHNMHHIFPVTSSNAFELARSYELNTYLRDSKLQAVQARVERCIQQNRMKVTNDSGRMFIQEEMDEEDQKVDGNITQANAPTATRADKTTFSSLQLSLIDFSSTGNISFHSTTAQPYRIRWLVDEDVQFNMDENKIKVAFNYGTGIDNNHKSDSSESRRYRSQRYEFEVFLPRVQSKVLFVVGLRSILRLQLQIPPNIYRIPVSQPGTRSYPIPWISPLDPSDQRLAHLLVYQLEFNNNDNPQLLEVMKEFGRHIQIVNSLPPTPLSIDSSPWLGWSDKFDAQFECMSFSIRYLLHALVTARKLALHDSHQVKQLVEILKLYPPSHCLHVLTTCLVADSPGGGVNARMPLAKLIHGFTSVSTPTNTVKPAIKIALESNPTSNAFLLRQIYVTPTRVLLHPPSYDSSSTNRILKFYRNYSHRFIRIKFVSETLNDISSNHDTFIHQRIHSIMTDGIFIGGIRFVFLAYSNSQLRAHSAWFYCEEKVHAFDETDESFKQLPTADEIRQSIGDVSDIATVGKQASRLGLAFSSTICQVPIEPADVCIIPDINCGGSILSDGIGVISRQLADRIIRSLQLPSATSAFQIRYQGSKGVVAVCHESLSSKLLVGGAHLALRPSMMKFKGNPTHVDLEICAAAKPMPLYLNRQIIPILSSMGVLDQSFMQQLNCCLRELERAKSNTSHALQLLRNHARHKSSVIQLLESGFDIKQEQYLHQFVCTIIGKLLIEVQTRFRIPVPHGIRLMGVLDESSQLPEGFVFFQTKSTPMPAEGSQLIIGRDPSLHPGDIRLLKLCSPDSYPQLSHLFDVLVFSSRGDRLEANKMSGGDLDGDTFFIIWDPTISTADLKQHQPLQYDAVPTVVPAAPKETVGGQLRVDQAALISFFLSYLSNASLGKIANSHAAWADFSPDGVQSPQCLQLAQLHSDAVDFIKTNKPVKIEKWLIRRQLPSWMGVTYKEKYESKKILGQLFERAKQAAAISNTSIVTNADQSQKGLYDLTLLIPGYEFYEHDALLVYGDYERDCWLLSKEFDIENESELMSGFITTPSTRIHYDEETCNRINAAVNQLSSKYIRRFWMGLSGPMDSERLKKASAWYKTAYTAHEKSELNKPYLSFGFLMIEPLCTLRQMKLPVVGVKQNNSTTTLAAFDSQSKSTTLVDLQSRGDLLVRSGDFTNALTSYESAIKQGSDTFSFTPRRVMSELYARLSQCCSALHLSTRAVDAARTAIQLDAQNYRAYELLHEAELSALPQSAASNHTATFIQFTVDLILSYAHNRSQVDQDQQKAVEVLTCLQQLPYTRHITQLTQIVAVGDSKELIEAVEKGARIFLLKSGEYIIPFAIRLPVLMIGLSDDVRLVGMTSHALIVHGTQSKYVVSRVQFGSILKRAKVPFSAVCVESGAQLILHQCRIIDYDENGLLVDGDGSETILIDCQFLRCLKAAVEIRMGGSLSASNCIFHGVRQGVSCYGGARQLVLYKCQIRDSDKEGILIGGNNNNAASRFQQELRNNQDYNLESNGTSESVPATTGAKITKEANIWAEQNSRIIDVSIIECTVQNCGLFGMSIDGGDLNVSIFGCTVRQNKPHNIYIKGGANVRISASHIYHGNFDGVAIDCNYNGTVHLRHNCFIGYSKQRLVQNFCSASQFRGKYASSASSDFHSFNQLTGMWSKPAIDEQSQTFTVDALDQLPTLTDLALRCAQLNRLKSIKPPLSLIHLPIEDTRQICRLLLRDPAKLYYYAIGNSLATNLASNIKLDEQVPSHLTCLLTQVRDIRHILRTVAHLESGVLSNPQTTVTQLQPQTINISFILHDSISILARCVLLLYLIEAGTTPVDVISIWANIGLTDDQQQLLHRALMMLSGGALPTWLYVPINSTMVNDLRETYLIWLHNTMPLAEMINRRAEFMQNPECEDAFVRLSLDAIKSQFSADSFSSTIEASFTTHLRHYAKYGSIEFDKSALLSHPNPTMMEAPQLSFNLYYSSSIYRAVRLVDNQKDALSQIPSNAKRNSNFLPSTLMKMLTPQIEALQSVLSAKSTSHTIIQIGIITGSISQFQYALPHMCLASSGHLSSSTISINQFDFIDFSNLMDYESLPCMLQIGMVLLKPLVHARLWTQGIKWALLPQLRMMKQKQKDVQLKSVIDSFITIATGFTLVELATLMNIQLERFELLVQQKDSFGPVSLVWQRSVSSASSSGLVTTTNICLDTVRRGFDRFSHFHLSLPWQRTPSNISWMLGGCASSLIHLLDVYRRKCSPEQQPSPLIDLVHQLFQPCQSSTATSSSTSHSNKFYLLHQVELETQSIVQNYDDTQLVTRDIVFLRFQLKVNLLKLNRSSELHAQLIFTRKEISDKHPIADQLVSDAIVQVMDAFSFDLNSHELQFLIVEPYYTTYQPYWLTLVAVTDYRQPHRLESNDKFSDVVQLSQSIQISQGQPQEDFYIQPWSNQPRSPLLPVGLSHQTSTYRSESDAAVTSHPMWVRRSWLKWKEIGNTAFRNAKHAGAIQCYSNGLQADQDILLLLLIKISFCYLRSDYNIHSFVYALSAFSISPISVPALLLCTINLFQLGAELLSMARWFQEQSERQIRVEPREKQRISSQLQMEITHQLTRMLESHIYQNSDAPTTKCVSSASVERVTSTVLTRKVAIVNALEYILPHYESCASQFSSEISPNNIMQRDGDGDQLIQAGSVLEARELFQHILFSLRSRVVLWTNRAICTSKLVDTDGNCLLDAFVATVIDPNFIKADIKLVESLQQMKKLSLALLVCQNALKKDAAVKETKNQLHELRLQLSNLIQIDQAIGSTTVSDGTSSTLTQPIPAERRVRAKRNETRTTGDRLESIEYLNQLFAEEFGADPKSNNLYDERISNFYDEFVQANSWPLHVDKDECTQTLLTAYQTSRMTPTFSHMLELPDDDKSYHQFLGEKLSRRLPNADKDLKWWSEAPVADVRFHYERQSESDLHNSGSSESRWFRSWYNTSFRPDILTKGTVHVLIGPKHLDLSAIWNAQLQSTKTCNGPLLIYGHGPNVPCVTKTLIIIQMFKDHIKTNRQKTSSSSTTHSSAIHMCDSDLIDCVIEVWFSSSLRPTSLNLFRQAIMNLIQEAVSPKEPSDCIQPDVLMLLKHWQSSHIPLSTARVDWLSSHDDPIEAANLKLKTDRLIYLTYALTGDVFTAVGSSLANPTMYDVPNWTRALDESIFHIIPLKELIMNRQESTDILDAAIKYLRHGVNVLLNWLTNDDVRIVSCRYSPIGINSPVVREIHSLQPWTISWGNTMDFMSPSKFHELARTCSGDEDTVHYCYSLNWLYCVKGGYLLDYAHGSRVDLLKLTKTHLQRMLTGLIGAESLNKFLLMPPVENVLNSSSYMLGIQHSGRWLSAFFDASRTGGPVQQIPAATEPQAYNVFHYTQHHLTFSYTYDMSIKYGVEPGSRCMNPTCTNIEPLMPKICSRCKAACYCSQVCQKAHWKVHKSTCRPMSTMI